MEEGKLTDQLVALAASVSPRLWQLSCSAYARQLRANHKFLEASHYLLAIREVKEAVQVCKGSNKIGRVEIEYFIHQTF